MLVDVVRTRDPMPARSSSVCFLLLRIGVVSSLEPHKVVTLRVPLPTAWWVGHREGKYSMDAEFPVPLLRSLFSSSILSHASLSVSRVCTLGKIEVEREVPRGHSCPVPRGTVHARERDSLEECESDENIHTKTKEKQQTSSRSSKLA